MSQRACPINRHESLPSGQVSLYEHFGQIRVMYSTMCSPASATSGAPSASARNAAFIAAKLALGLLISTAVHTQFQAMQMRVFVLRPSIRFSGVILHFDDIRLTRAEGVGDPNALD